MERAEAAEVELLKSIFHSLPPIRCAVIGVRVTGRPNPPPPPSLAHTSIPTVFVAQVPGRKHL